MEIGVTVGDSIGRVDATADRFEFAEFGLGETADLSTAVDADRLDAALAENDLALDVHLPFKQVVATPVPEINDAIVAFQERLLAWAGERGARKAVLHATQRNPHDTDLRETFADQLARIVAAGESHGVEVVVENVGHQAKGLQLSVLADIANEVDAPVCFDVGHAYMEDGTEGVERFLGACGDRVSHLHVHDVRGRGDTHMPVGAGEVDFDAMGEHLDEFDGTVAIEVFTDDETHLVDSAERVAERLGATR